MNLKTSITALAMLGFMAGASSALADTVVFTEGFESGLGAWTGKSGGAHNGEIIDDPLEGLPDHALRFNATDSAGNIFTSSTFSSSAGEWKLEFDYLGGCTTGDCGGFIGYSEGLPGSHVWLAGSNSTSGASPILTNAGDWVHYTISFVAAGAIHLMLEDFSGTSPSRARDAYFDNITLTAVPVPAAVWLLGSALLGAGLVGRRRQQIGRA